MAPKPPPRAPKTSPSLDFNRFVVDFVRFFYYFLYHVGYFLSGLPHYFFGYLELSFSNFWPQVQMCWGRPQGSVRSQKKCDVAHLLSSLPLCFCYLEPYFSSFWPQIFRDRQQSHQRIAVHGTVAGLPEAIEIIRNDEFLKITKSRRRGMT